jgi:hypothetical protein
MQLLDQPGFAGLRCLFGRSFPITAALPALVPYLCNACLHKLTKPELIGQNAALQQENAELWRELRLLFDDHVALMAAALRTVGLVEPCLPSPPKAPPSGDSWLHVIKHDGFRILALRDGSPGYPVELILSG